MIRKVLIIDDSNLMHKVYELAFAGSEWNGVSLIHAHDGRQALDALAAHPEIGLVILDINMPVMSGLEFLQTFRCEKAFDDVPVIIVSNEGSEADKARGMQAGAAGYLTKPFKPEDLAVTIHRVLDLP